MKIINKDSLKLFCLVVILAMSLPAHAKKDKHKAGKKMHDWEKADALIYQRIDDMQSILEPAAPISLPGLAGASGTEGATGPMGPAGPIGLPGLAGASGTEGATGSMGPMGPAGTNGTIGADGISGPMGPAGPIGLPGLAGAEGLPGIDGLDGLPGKDAPDRTAELCALYNVLSEASLIGALTVPEYCTGSGKPPSFYTLGSTGPGGGIVFHVTEGGLHGLEAAPEDQSAGAQWGCYGAPVAGADGQVIYTGAQNTSDILEAGCVENPNQPGAGEIAAQIADAYVSFNSNGDSYSDWFLPSGDELNLLFINKDSVGGFTASSNAYWSSSEVSHVYGLVQYFTGGTQAIIHKYYTFGVRAIREF